MRQNMNQPMQFPPLQILCLAESLSRGLCPQSEHRIMSRGVSQIARPDDKPIAVIYATPRTNQEAGVVSARGDMRRGEIVTLQPKPL